MRVLVTGSRNWTDVVAIRLAILRAIRGVMHPAEYGDGPELWPYGGFVFIDETDPTADEIGGGHRE